MLNKIFLMPQLPLPRSSYDLFVNDFPYDFSASCLRSSCDFFRGQTRTKAYREFADILQQPQGYRAVIVLSYKSNDAHTMTLR